MHSVVRSVFRILAVAVAATAFGLGGATPVLADQAKVAPGAHLSELGFGAHLFGPDLKAEDLLGQVVVFNMGGG